MKKKIQVSFWNQIYSDIMKYNGTVLKSEFYSVWIISQFKK
jgi:hypothetical protein